MAMSCVFLLLLSVCAALASGSIDIANTEDDLTVQDMKVILTKQSEQLQRLERRLAVLENKEQNDRCCESTIEIVDGTGRGRKRILVPTKSMAQGDYPAFFASMSKDEHTVGPHHTLIFDSVKTNILNGYNNNSGVFQVPQTGTYAFSYAISNIGGSLCIELVRNAAAVDALYTDASNSQDMTGKIYIGYFDANDIVFVRIHSSRAGAGYISSDSCGYSSFAGYRIM